MTAQRSSKQDDQPKGVRPPQRLAGLRGLVEALRRIPAGFRRPETLMLAMAVLASFGAHMPPYMGLGALAEYWEKKEAERAAREPVEVSFEWNEEPPADEPEPPEPEPVEPEPEKRKPEVKPEPDPEPEAKKERLAEKKEPEPEPEKVSTVQLEPPPPPPPPPDPRKQSITQKSDDPDVEPPPDARFLAEESRRVEEETVAMVRDEAKSQDDPEPEASAPEDRGVEEAGDERDLEDEVDTFNEQGGDEGEKFVEETVEQRPPPATVQEREGTPLPGREARAEQAEVAPSMPAPGTVIKDPLGSFTIATADEPQERQRNQAAQRGGHAGPRGTHNPKLQVSWQTFEDTYDEDTLAREREPQRRRNVGSSQRKKRWKKFRAATENYVVGAKPGNTTALNAAADPFAAYIAAFHRHLHMEFAYEFLGNLPATGTLADLSLVTRIEMVINPDGTLDRVGVVRSSGQTMFDLGAFTAVMDGAPYPRPPEKIRSADGKVYLHWDLHRNHSQCGTWNAAPYIVTNPPDVDSDGRLAPPGMQLGPVRREPG